MQKEDLHNKCITVMGLGLHGGGVDTVRFLVRHGARVTVTDQQDEKALASSVAQLRSCENLRFVLGAHRYEDFETADMVVKAPNVPWDNVYICHAQAHGIPVYTDASLFYALIRQPTIGITGSKGKTTTAQALLHILQFAQKSPVAVGVGQEPMLGKLDAMTREDIPVCELSSWRLASMGRMKQSPPIAVVTNLLHDHQNYYGSMVDYEQDKFAITQYQSSDDVLILNADDRRLQAWARRSHARIVWVSMGDASRGKRGLLVDDGVVYEYDARERMALYALNTLRIRGEHTQCNIMLAAAAARACGVAPEVIATALTTFVGVAHRFETVAIIDGVRYINDTAATIPDAAIASIWTCPKPPIVIAGGADKALDFAAFANVLAHETKAVVLLDGSATQKIIALLRQSGLQVPRVVDTMDDAVAVAQSFAGQGDYILLSPGAASFGLFAHEFDRGDAFIRIVKHYEDK